MTVDCIYVAASARDARYTRICVASIRAVYPVVQVKLLAGGPLEQGLAAELARYWDVGLAGVRAGDWGWGFVKLEPLFGRPGERFMVVDPDTVFAGPVLAAWDDTADFVVDDERQSEADTHRLYYDWCKVSAVDPAAAPPQFVFNSGQWFGTAGVLNRDDFAAWIDWSGMPPKLRHAGLFMPGDQGVLNYVLNQRVASGAVRVARRKIMHWPGHGMNALSARAIAERRAPPLVIHWAGLKQPRLAAMPGADILRHFERHYYARLPAGGLRRLWAGLAYAAAERRDNLLVRARQRLVPVHS